MGYNSENYRRIRGEYETKYKRAHEDADRRRAQLHDAVPGVREIDAQLGRVGLEIMNAIVKGGAATAKQISDICAKNEQLQAKRAELLSKYGYPEDYSDVRYECPVCSDSGFVDGKMCACMKKELVMAGCESSGMGHLMRSQSFENFSLDYYRQNAAELSEMDRNLSVAYRYAENFKVGVSGNLLLMGQSGQYNYKRCTLRNETAAAQLSVFEFAKATLNTAFLLSKKYMPYYKWSFRALRELSPDCKALASDLEYLLSSGNDETQLKKKCEIIENICTDISQKLKEQDIADAVGADTEWLAYAVNDMIKDNAIRNMHILAAV